MIDSLGCKIRPTFLYTQGLKKLKLYQFFLENMYMFLNIKKKIFFFIKILFIYILKLNEGLICDLSINSNTSRNASLA